MEKFICKYCGKEFEKSSQLGGHIIRCKLNPKYEDNIKNCNNLNKNNSERKNKEYWKDKICYCSYCNKLLHSENSLKQHEIRCKENPNHIQYELYKHNLKVHNNEIEIWNKNKTGKDNISIKKQSLNLKKYYENHEHHNKGLIMSETEKEKRRLGIINYLKKIKKDFKPQYSINGCKYIDKLNEEKHWNLQHAKNGGEVEINGYFVDGYDKELNIVFEYDEKHHYKDVFNNILNNKDIQRQNNIINELHCEFWRYNEYMNLLYKVN